MKKALGFISGSYLYLLSAKSIFALEVSPTPVVKIPLEAPSGSVPDIGVANLPQFIISLLFVLGIIFAVSYLIYGGIRWVLSKGDKTKVEEARNHIVAAIVGVVIVAAAFFFINITFTFLTGKPFEFGKNLCIPNLTSPDCSPSACTLHKSETECTKNNCTWSTKGTDTEKKSTCS